VELYFSDFIYFIPIFSLLFIFIFLTLFLKAGFEKFDKNFLFYYLLFNLVFLSVITTVFYLKILSILGFLKWINIMIFLSLFHAINFIGICYIYKENNDYSKNELFLEKKTDKSILAVFDILINLCLICFYFLIGLYLDNLLEKVKINSLFILTWLFFFIIIIKNYYQIKKINNYLEWRNVVIS